MAWLIHPRELAGAAGRGSGRWQLTAESDEYGGPFPLCACREGHGDPVEAQNCEEAMERKKFYQGSPRVIREDGRVSRG